MADELLTFLECVEISQETKTKKKHLLLGNGFSIAYEPNIFSYKSLYEKSKPTLSKELIEVFEKLEIYDFETVIKNLITGISIIDVYEPENKK